MELSSRTFRFLKLNGAVLLVFFFTFSLIVFVRYYLSVDREPVAFLVGILLFVAGCVVTGLHWSLLTGVKRGMILVREPRVQK